MLFQKRFQHNLKQFAYKKPQIKYRLDKELLFQARQKKSLKQKIHTNYGTYLTLVLNKRSELFRFVSKVDKNLSVFSISMDRIGKGFLFHTSKNKKISSIFLLVVESWNRQHHGQTIHPTEKLNSMNLFKILFVVTWA